MDNSGVIEKAGAVYKLHDSKYSKIKYRSHDSLSI